MANPYDYMRYILPHYRRGIMEKNQISEENLFYKHDTPINWNMKKIASTGADAWEVGYIYRSQLQSYPDHRMPISSYFFPRITPPQKYWWCRNGNWMPYWGEETKKRQNLAKEIRAFWMNKWFGETIPEIKKTILETTNLPEDIVEFLPRYFEYPYEIKSI